MSAFNAALTRAGVVLAAIMIASMTIIVIVGVFFRYVLNNSITWVEDFSLIMMVTTAFIVAPFAYRNGANVAIGLFVSGFNDRVLRTIRMLIDVLILWIIYRYFFESLALVERGWGIRVNSIPIPWAWCYMIIPVCFVAMASVGVELLLRELYAFTDASRREPLPAVDGTVTTIAQGADDD